MSVLSFPRVYFQGVIEWDPCTFNNNDWQEFPTYDGVNAALNWPFLAGYGITQQNFYSTLRPWAIGLLPDCVDSPGGERVPAEWNMFGTHGVKFVNDSQGTVKTVITGGALSPSEPVTNDPLIGGPVAIKGDRSPGSKTDGAARLVDTNPASFWSSQIYFGHMAFGGDDCAIRGPRNYRMHSRWVNMNRIYTADSKLAAPAAAFGCCFQTSIPFDEVQWPAPGTSPLADQLQTASSGPNALGIMVRFTAYVNVYFKNGILNDIKVRPSNYKDLANDLAAAFNGWNNGSGNTDLFFSNPCYSHIVGTLGVWNDWEVASAPVGRFLAPASVLTPAGSGAVATPPPAAPGAAMPAAMTAAKRPALGKQAAMVMAAGAPAPPAPVGLGPVVVYVDGGNEVISIDFSSAIPETGKPDIWPSDLTKANFGTLDFGVTNGGVFTSIVQIPYDQYAQAAYEATAGIIDIPFASTLTGPATGSLLENGSIVIQVEQPAPNPSGLPVATAALAEQQYSAQTDERGIYLDENGSTTFDVTVYDFGQPSPNTTVLVAQYDQGLGLISTVAMPLVFMEGQQPLEVSPGSFTNVTIVTSNGSGIASVSISAMTPGYAVLAFFPYSGDTAPTPPPALAGPPGTLIAITSAFYTTVRVLPFDEGLPERLVKLWNTTQDKTLVWQFVYNEILYLYDMLFNVMLTVFNLGDQGSVEASIPYIWPAISAEAAKENTQAMPITRDMSAAKRLTLQLWMYLYTMNYSVSNFNVHSIPKGWAPPPPSPAAQNK